MLGRTHMVFGGLFMGLAGPLLADAVGHPLTPATCALGIGLAAVAGLLPDIDHPDAFLTKGKIPLPRQFGALGWLLGQILSLPPRIAGVFVRGAMGHRGGTHSLVFLLLWTVLALPIYLVLFGIIAWIAGLFLAIFGVDFPVSAIWTYLHSILLPAMPVAMIIVGLGYLSHLFSDSLNTAPVPWLWPFSQKRYFFLPKGLRVRVSSHREDIIRSLLLVLLAFVFIFQVVLPAASSLDKGSSVHDAFLGKSKAKTVVQTPKKKTPAPVTRHPVTPHLPK